MTLAGEPDNRAADHAVEIMVGVTAPQCAEVRRRVSAAARLAGLNDERASRFTLAVNEIVINGVTHGRGPVTVTIETGGSSVVVEVTDRGSGIPETAAGRLPPTNAVGGRGIWLARQFSDVLTISSGDSGTVVRLVAERTD
jgi:anti-sigma regulatory factor (Ser/Thr protein kinase)